MVSLPPAIRNSSSVPITDPSAARCSADARHAFVGNEARLAIGLAGEPRSTGRYSMSSTVRTLVRRASSSARRLVRLTWSVEKCVPGDQQCFEEAMNASSKSSFVDGHVRAVIAIEHERERVAVFQAEQHQPGEPVEVDAHVTGVQPSRSSVSVRKRPMWSLPTRASIAEVRPSRAQPNAIFADDPPRYFAKLDTSSSRAPTCCA